MKRRKQVTRCYVRCADGIYRNQFEIGMHQARAGKKEPGIYEHPHLKQGFNAILRESPIARGLQELRVSQQKLFDRLKAEAMA